MEDTEKYTTCVFLLCFSTRPLPLTATLAQYCFLPRELYCKLATTCLARERRFPSFLKSANVDSLRQKKRLPSQELDHAKNKPGAVLVSRTLTRFAATLKQGLQMPGGNFHSKMRSHVVHKKMRDNTASKHRCRIDALSEKNG